MIAQKAIGQRLVLAQQAQQQVLRLNVRRAELAGLITGEEDYAPCFLCIPLEHMTSPQMSPVTSAGNIVLPSPVQPTTAPGRSLSVLPAPPSQRLNNAAPDKPAVCLLLQTQKPEPFTPAKR